MSQILIPTSMPQEPPTPENNPFRYGWRYVKRVLPDGSVDFDRIPLSLEDVLHPEFEDVMPQASPHDWDRVYLTYIFDRQIAHDPSALVLGDVLVFWDVPGLRQHSPDISVFFGVRDPKAPRTAFRILDEGVRPTLFLEVVSPDYRNNDVVIKVEHYHRGRVPFYIIVDRERVEGPIRLIGYRYRPEAFQVMPLDDQGRLWLEPLKLWLGTKGNRVICYDGVSGRELGDYAQVSRELEAAEGNARQEAEARIAAEGHARQESEARIAAERRIRELEEELRRIRESKMIP